MLPGTYSNTEEVTLLRVTLTKKVKIKVEKRKRSKKKKKHKKKGRNVKKGRKGKKKEKVQKRRKGKKVRNFFLRNIFYNLLLRELHKKQPKKEREREK